MLSRLRALSSRYSIAQKRVLSTLIAVCLSISTLTLALANILGNTLAADSGYAIPIEGYPNTGPYIGWWAYNPGYDNAVSDGTHLGVDIPGTPGTPVYAVRSGIIKYSADGNGYAGKNGGGLTIIEHENDKGGKFYALYGHIIRFRVGGTVNQGEKIGEINNLEGMPHLHFGITTSYNSADQAMKGYRSRGGDTFGFVNPVTYLNENCSDSPAPPYPTPPPGYTDVTPSFATSITNKTIYIKSVVNGKYALNSQPTGNTNVLFLSENKGTAEEFSVHQYMELGVWTGSVCLKSVANGKWLRVNGNSAVSASLDGAILPNEAIFRIYRNNANGNYYLRVRSTGYYLAANLNSAYDDLFLGDSNPPGGWERFQLEVKPAYTASSTLANGYYAIQHKTSGKYVTAAGGTANDTPLVLYEDGNGSSPGISQDQQFNFERQSDGTYIFSARHSGKAIEVYNLDLCNDAKIIQWPKGNTNQQKWFVIDMGDSYYKLFNRLSGSGLTVYNNATANGTSIIQFIDHNSDAQRFNLIRQDFAITYNANNGTGAPATQTKWRDITLALATGQPTRTGYTFKGWATSANATTAQYQPGANYTANANLTLYAVWESNQPGPYTVTYNANGGMSPPAPQAKQHGVPLTLTEDRALWAGRLCIGWATTPDAAEALYFPGGIYTADANVVLYAVWRDMYYVVYDANGGENPPEMHSKIHGEPLTLRTEQPTREGYTFLGWSTDKDATEAEYQPGGSYTNNAALMLFAIWEEGVTQPDTYAVAYNANGGTGAPPTQTKTHDIALTLSNTEPTRGTYDFLGWATSANATTAQYQPGSSYTANANVTLYAVWNNPVVPLYIVTYNANGGINPPEEQTKTQDIILTLSSDVPTRSGYTFKGWATGANATTAQYQPGASYTANASVTLYAVWEADHTHSFGNEWESDDTNHWHECSCGEKTDMVEHTPGDWIVDVAATATEYGSRHKECTVCGYVTEAGIIPATGEEHTHAFGNVWESNAVNHWHECDCGAITDSAPHAPGNWIIDIAATVTEDGSKHKECAICGYVTETEAIPATGEGHTHTFGEWMRDSSKHWRECSCGEKTDLAEHTPGNWIVDIAATATEDGSRHKECTVCGHVTVTEAIPATDTTPPTGTILMKTKGFSSFMNTITFGLFFKDTIDVTVTAADGESGVNTVEYLKSETKLSGETDWDSLTWTAIGNGGTFSISANWKGIVYARITDHAGNVSVISSEGLVVFTDSAAATSSISFIKGSGEDKTANVTLNGNTIDKITNGTAVLTPGTDYAVSGGAITFKASYLETLDAGATPYTLTVSYNPLGMSYVEAAENDTPSSTAISLTVLPPGHAHTWGEWESDAASHWHECSCGEKSDTAVHVPGDWIIDIAATATEDGSKHKECIVCGYATDIAAIPVTGEGHTHTFGNEWKKDETIHWKECSCGEKGDFAPHTPGDWIVDVAATATTAGSKHKECTVCGYSTVTEVIPATGEGHTHSYGIAWTKDATGHWHECSCGEKDGFAAHLPGDWIIDVAATATAQGSRHKECTICGFITATEAIPATGAGHTHSFGTAWKKDAAGHWHECSCGEKDGFAAHTPGSWVVDVAATATADGSRHRECTICGLLTATDTIPVTGSTPVYKITSGANQSWKKGAVAGATITCDGDFSKFVELKVDGSVITAANYTKASGSTIISLNASYLETLAPGTHTVEFVYSDGSVQTGLTILANDNITPVPANNGGSDTSNSFLNPSNGNSGGAGFPKTGEHLSGATIALSIFLLLDLAFVAWKIYEHVRRPRRRVLLKL